MTKPMPIPPRVLRASLAVAAVVVFVTLFWRFRHVVMDDPFITFRYARNLVSGNGLVFNAGERVEGYSNFAWMLCSTLPIVLGVDPLFAARAAGVASGIAMLLAMALGIGGRFAGEDGRPLGLAPWGAVLLAGSYPLAVAASGALETLQYSLCLFVALMLAARAAWRPGRFTPWTLAAALVATSMSRPEAPMIVAAPVLLLVPAGRDGRRALLKALAAWAVCYGVYTCARFAYFGSVVPNTVSAKVGGGFAASVRAGLVYLSAWLLTPSLAVVLAGTAAVLAAIWKMAFAGERREFHFQSLACGTFIALQVTFMVCVSGDWMPGMRFVVPLLAPLCFLAGAWLERLPSLVPAAVALGVCASAPYVARHERIQGARSLEWVRVNFPDRTSVAPLVQIGRDLPTFATPDDVVALTEVGAVPFESGVRALDMFGLVDPELAALGGGLHRTFSGRIVLDRKPDFLLLGFTNPGWGDPVATWEPDRDVVADPRFATEYREVKRWPRDMAADDLNVFPGWMALYARVDGGSTETKAGGE